MATANFNPERHLYDHNGVVVPSVTQVLALAGVDDVSGVPLYYLERAAGIGTAVHAACQFLDQDDLDLESLDEAIVGYVLSYQRFRVDYDFRSLGIEQFHIANVDGNYYGMCVDRIGEFEGRPTVLDLKTASKRQHSWQIQTAAYSVGLADSVESPGCSRIVVHLSKQGTYDLIRHTDESDLEVWWAALRLAHWKLKHGRRLPR